MILEKIIADNLQGKRILITGGTGFFGKSILKYFLSKNIKPACISILTRNANKFCENYPELAGSSYINYIEQDIRYLNSNNANYDYVIHAATSVVDKVEPTQLIDEIVQGTKNSLEFAIASGATSFINVSSGAIYGPIPKISSVTENYCGFPKIESDISSYGLGKILSEHYSYLYSKKYDLKVTSLRCFCFGGEYLDANHYVLGYLIKQALANKDIVVQSGSGVYRSYLSTQDLVEWMLYLLIQSKDRLNNYDVYNIGSNEAISIHDLAVMVKDTLNSQSKISYANLNDSSVSFYVPNIDKILQLGIKMNFSLSKIIQDTGAYYINSKQI